MIRYKVIEDQKMVIAILDNSNREGSRDERTCRNDAVSKVRKLISWELSDEDKKILQMAPRYVGKAVCHNDDVFDVEEGKRIAKKKVLDKYHNALHRRVSKFYSRKISEAKNLVHYLNKN